MTTPADRNRYYGIISRQPRTSGLEALTHSTSEVDLSDQRLDDSMRSTRNDLYRIVRSYLGNDPKLLKIADRIVERGTSALRSLREIEDDSAFEDPGGLEAIIRTNGTRPSFLIRNGEVDQLSSPVGEWEDALDDCALTLGQTVEAVGRIDDPSSRDGYVGTGYLIQEDVILTNRHVLQEIAHAGPDKAWTLNKDVAIDFGHEFRGLASSGRRLLKGVLFCAEEEIDGENIDHSKLDLVVIALESSADATRRRFLPIDVTSDWTHGSPTIFTIGYPAPPPSGTYNQTLLEQLFEGTYGCKRLAPGMVLEGERPHSAWTFAHDATTLGGNSGSVVLVMKRPQAAVGLHYGGRRTAPAENWGHSLARVLAAIDAKSGQSLRTILTNWGVEFVTQSMTSVR